MTASVTLQDGSCRVEVPCERPAREPRLELERAARFAVGCAGLVQPTGVEWRDGALVIDYPRPTEPMLGSHEPAQSASVGAWLVALADVLASLHDLGVAHGHVRADLVAIENAGIRLLGFGVEAVARAVGGAALAAEALPERYRAPEQRGATPAAASPWTDTYAFGVIAAELVGESRLEGRVKELVEAASSASLAQRPADLRRFARELDEALREQAARVAAPGARAAAGAPRPEALPESPRPEPQPVPQAELKAPPAPPPIPEPIAPPPVSRAGKSSAAWIIALVMGALLMVVGGGVLFAIAIARPSRPSVSVATAPPPVIEFDAGAPVYDPDGAPAPLPSGSSAQSAGDAGEASEPTKVPDLSSANIDRDARVSTADTTAAIPLDSHVPVWGKPDAAVTLVVFGDFECPHTRRLLPVVLTLKNALGDDLRLAWRNRPLAGNELARAAAETAAAVHAEHGAAVFWRFIGEAAKDRDSPTDERLGRWIAAAGGDRARVVAARASQAPRVERDLTLAGRFDVRATPTVFLNGIRLEGEQALEELRRQAQSEIAAARGMLASGAESSTLYAARVRKNLIGLGPDVAVRTCPELGNSPSRGGSAPLVTIVEFSDFECPFCKRLQPTLDRAIARHGGDVRLVWKNLPLPSHSRARPAAMLAIEAFERGGSSKFWRVHDLLFEQSTSLDDDALRAIATKAGLDANAALEVVRRSGHEARIDADVRAAKKLGVSGTPTLFVNGRKIEGAVPFEKLAAVVQEELEAARRQLASGTPRDRIYATVCGAR